MNLKELLEQIENKIISAEECGESPENIKVSIQIDDHYNNFISCDDFEVPYDNDVQVYGCCFHHVVDENTVITKK